MLYKKFFIIIFITVLSLSPLSSFAMQFNPHYIISDQSMQDSQSMSLAHIQTFLEEQNSFLATYFAPDKDGIMRSTAEIIYNAGKDNGISPKYLLVKLQKEQSLITSKNPTQKALDWATGYAVCDSCSKDDPEIQAFKGFGNQVDLAARVIRKYYNEVHNLGYIKKPFILYSIDGINVVPQNYATAFLYTYTPHIEGNQNFWILWNRWFEQIYPDGTLLKLKGSPDIYLIRGGKKRKIANMRALELRFDPKLIVEVETHELEQYQDGGILSFPNYSILQDGENYYLVDFDTIRPFESSQVVRSLGYNPGEIIQVESEDLLAYARGKNITMNNTDFQGKLVQLSASGDFYYIKDGIASPITYKQISDIRFGKQIPTVIDPTTLASYEEGTALLLENGTLIHMPNSPHVYVIDNGYKRHIPNEEIFVKLGYQWENIYEVDLFTGMLHPTGEPMKLREEIPDIVLPPLVENQILQTNEENKKVFLETGITYPTPLLEQSIVGTEYTTDIESYLIADYQTGHIYAGKNIDSPRPIASFTKVLTALAAFENNFDLNNSTIYNPLIHASDYARIDLTAGEEILNDDILSSALIYSSNTAANMLIADVENHFKSLEKILSDLKLENTSIVDASGLSIQNYSTAKEYLAIFKYALEHPDILRTLMRDSFSFEELKDRDGNPTHSGNHTNLLQRQDHSQYEVLASKTGYLYESGFNIAMLVKRKSDNKEFIILTLGNPDYQSKYDKEDELINWAMQTF